MSPQDTNATLSEQLTGEAKNNTLPTIIVTGAAGNLGEKTAKHLISCKHVIDGKQKYRLVLMDSSPCPADLDLKNNPNGHVVEYVQCDFSKYEPYWVSKFNSSSAAFLFAAKNPTPDATSKDAYVSMMINSHVLEACAAGRTKTVIFASSNHVVGGMLREKNKIAPNADPNFGTKYQIRGTSMDSTLYASAKVAGEVQIQAMLASGRLNKAVILRIGFCQPGDNPKSTLPKTGNPNKEAHDEKLKSKKDEGDEAFIMSWWKGMYLKNEDLERLVDSCLTPAVDKSSKKALYVNGVSNNPNMRWTLDNEIGYTPT
jgi:nucleoside-diphosphate-sugar epimerase